MKSLFFGGAPSLQVYKQDVKVSKQVYSVCRNPFVGAFSEQSQASIPLMRISRSRRRFSKALINNHRLLFVILVAY